MRWPLGNSQEDVGTADRFEAAKGGGVGAVGEVVGENRDVEPIAPREIGTELRHQGVSCVCASGCDGDVGRRKHD